jgi:hypothetical protein
MGLMDVGVGEMRVVRAHQRQVAGVGGLDEEGLGRRLGLGAAGLALGVALDLHIEPARIKRGQPLQQRLGLRAPPVSDQAPERAVRAARQADHAFGMGREIVERHAARAVGGVEKRLRGQLHQPA